MYLLIRFIAMMVSYVSYVYHCTTSGINYILVYYLMSNKVMINSWKCKERLCLVYLMYEFSETEAKYPLHIFLKEIVWCINRQTYHLLDLCLRVLCCSLMLLFLQSDCCLATQDITYNKYCRQWQAREKENIHIIQNCCSMKTIEIFIVIKSFWYSSRIILL